MRREFTLSATNPQFAVELTFYPSTIIVLNNTDQSVYLRVGATDIPNATFFDREILPTSNGIPSNVALPNNSYQFAGFLPTPTDTTKNVKVIFQGTANPFNNKFMPPNQFGGSGLSGNPLMSGLRNRHWQEYRLNASNPNQVMSLEFMADMCFILNNSDAWLYMNQGGTGTPNSSFNDLAIPPTSYTIFVPRGGFDFAGFLDSPFAKDCFIIFCYGYADEYAAIKQINGEWDWYLPPLTIPGLEFYFDWSIDPVNWQGVYDFTASDYTWFVPVGDLGSYVPGSGFLMSPTPAGTFARIVQAIPTQNLILQASFDFILSGSGGSYDIAAVGFENAIQVSFDNLAGSISVNGSYTRTTGIPTWDPSDIIDELVFRIRANGTMPLKQLRLVSATVDYYGIPF